MLGGEPREVDPNLFDYCGGVDTYLLMMNKQTQY